MNLCGEHGDNQSDIGTEVRAVACLEGEEGGVM